MVMPIGRGENSNPKSGSTAHDVTKHYITGLYVHNTGQLVLSRVWTPALKKKSRLQLPVAGKEYGERRKKEEYHLRQD